MRARILWFAVFLTVVVPGCTAHLGLLSQDELADVVIESNVYKVRRAAFEKLNDDNQLFRVAMTTKDRFGYKAVSKISDQNVIGRIVSESNNDGVVIRAIGKLKDQVWLENIALNSSDPQIRSAASSRIVSQSVLEKIATNDESFEVRVIAVRHLQRDVALARIAETDESVYVATTAISRLSSESALSRLLLKDAPWRVHSASFSRMEELGQINEAVFSNMAQKDYAREFKNLLVQINNPVLMRSMAGDYSSIASDGRESAARIQLVLQHPVIASKFANIVFTTEFAEKTQRYAYGSASKYMDGEQVEFAIKADIVGGIRGFRMVWSSEFPKYHEDKFVIAKVSGGEFLKRFLDIAKLNRSEWEELLPLSIPELGMDEAK